MWVFCPSSRGQKGLLYRVDKQVRQDKGEILKNGAKENNISNTMEMIIVEVTTC